jgi:hypothetical protein
MVSRMASYTRCRKSHRELASAHEGAVKHRSAAIGPHVEPSHGKWTSNAARRTFTTVPRKTPALMNSTSTWSPSFIFSFEIGTIVLPERRPCGMACPLVVPSPGDAALSLAFDLAAVPLAVEQCEASLARGAVALRRPLPVVLRCCGAVASLAVASLAVVLCCGVPCFFFGAFKWRLCCVRYR